MQGVQLKPWAQMLSGARKVGERGWAPHSRRVVSDSCLSLPLPCTPRAQAAVWPPVGLGLG